MGLVGQRTGRRWQMGDAVRVRLTRVDLTQRQIDFELVDADAATSHGTVRAPRRGAGAQRRRAGRAAAAAERRSPAAGAVADTAAGAAEARRARLGGC